MGSVKDTVSFSELIFVAKKNLKLNQKILFQLLAFDTAIENSAEMQSFGRRKRTIENVKFPEVKIVQTSCSMTHDGMIYANDDSNVGKIFNCFCIHNQQNEINYQCDLMENWKENECKCQKFGFCEKNGGNFTVPCLCKNNLCVQSENDQVSIEILNYLPSFFLPRKTDK